MMPHLTRVRRGRAGAQTVVESVPGVVRAGAADVADTAAPAADDMVAAYWYFWTGIAWPTFTLEAFDVRVGKFRRRVKP